MKPHGSGIEPDRTDRAASPRETITLRRAHEEDLRTLLPLVEAFHRWFGFGWNPETKPDLVARALRQPDQVQVWLIEQGSRPVGYAAVTYSFSLEFEGRIAVLDEFYLLPESRGQGWGTAALDQLEPALHRDGIRHLRLEVDDAHDRAAGLYARRGYRPGRTLWTKRLS